MGATILDQDELEPKWRVVCGVCGCGVVLCVVYVVCVVLCMLCVWCVCGVLCVVCGVWCVVCGVWCVGVLCVWCVCVCVCSSKNAVHRVCIQAGLALPFKPLLAGFPSPTSV